MTLLSVTQAPRSFVAVISSILLVFGFVSPAQGSNNQALTPSFGTQESVAGGFAVPITNWDASFTWEASASDCAVASVEDGWLTVTGVLPGQSVQARVFTERAGYDSGMATFTGTALSLIGASYLSASGTSGWVNDALADESGNIFALQNEAINGEVLIHKSSDNGRNWSTIHRLSSDNSSRSRLAVGPGQLLAVGYLTGFQENVRSNASVSLDGGSTWQTTVLSTPANIQEVAVATTANGWVIVSWRVYDGSSFRIATKKSLDGGVTWAAEELISPAGTSFYNVSMLRSSTGDVYAVWGRSEGLTAIEFDQATGTWGSAIELATTSNETASMRFGVDESGKLWAAWFSGPGPSRHVNIAAFDGSGWSPAIRATDNTGSYEGLALAVSADEAVVSWNLSGSALKVRRYDTEAGTWGTERSIFTGGQQMQNPFLASAGGGDFYLTFMKRSATPTGNLLPFYSLGTNGGDTWSSIVQVAPSSRANYVSRAVTSSTGVVTILWQEQFPLQRPKSTIVAATSNYSDPREIYQVAEINPGGSHALIYDMAQLNNKLYVIAKSDTTGFELFEFDGTNLRLVEDLYPGVGNGLYDTGFVAKTSTALYFQGTDGVTGYELYKFDGSSISLAIEFDPAQTTIDQTQNQIFPGSSPGSDGNAAVLGDLLFLNTDYPSAGTGYVIDLSTSPLVPQRLTDYFTGYAVSSFYGPVVVEDNLYFRAGSSIYQTDGVATPTVVPGTTGLNHFTLGGFDGKLLISASPGGSSPDIELLVWDPADPTTPAALAANINPYNTGGEAGSYPVGFATRCNEVFFTASSGFSGVVDNRELWKWDGYEATLAKDFWPGASASASGRPFSITALGDELFVFANDGTHGTEPWVMRGNQAEMLEDFRLGPSGSTSGSPRMFAWGETLYLPLWGATGIELYAYGIKPQGFTPAAYAPTYTITYDANGGTGTASQSVPSGTVTLDSGSGFQMAGKVLLGWDTVDSVATPTYGVSGTYSLVGNVTLYAIWGDEPTTPTAPTLPTISTPAGGATGTSGGDMELEGTNLAGVTKAEVDVKEAEIKEKSDTRLKLGLPEMDPGIYDLTLTSNFGRIVLQDAVRITGGLAAITPDAQAQISAWTKLGQSKDTVAMFAKNPFNIGKVQFFVNGSEIAWVRSVDAADPKFWRNGPDRYLLRRVDLKPGKNRFEIRVDGQQVWRTTYALAPG